MRFQSPLQQEANGLSQLLSLQLLLLQLHIELRQQKRILAFGFAARSCQPFRMLFKVAGGLATTNSA